MEIIKIPAQRVQVLRGDADATLEMLQAKLKARIDVDEDGAVELSGEPVDEYFGKGVIKAIGRGFEPSVALKLLQDEYGLNIIDLRDYARPEQMARIKGRIIGEEGKARMIIEKEAEVDLAIYGHTVGIIGKLEVLDVATTAVFKLIEGQPHSAVYFYLEKNRRRREEGDMRSRAGGMNRR
ncbi:MAG: RNA-processing protein [Candidatus Micrarchaeota archaeon]|nr:RNA-processing protein [Candidatus Micrarchaeota archaeon]